MTESEEGLKSLMMKVKEESEKAGLKLNIQNLRSWIRSHHFMANRWGNNGNRETLFSWAPKSLQMDCGHEIKRCLLLERKAMTNLDCILKNKDITLLTKVCIVKAMVSSSSHVWMWELDHKEGWVLKNWCFWTVVLEKTYESLGLQRDQISQS